MIQIEAELLNKFNLILRKMVFPAKTLTYVKGSKEYRRYAQLRPFGYTVRICDAF
jgi:hypothetical protein